MKTRLIKVLAAAILLLLPILNFAQAPPLGTASQFVLFSTVGAVSNTGISQLTGNVGSNSGSSTGFGNVNGVMNNNNGATAQCAADVLIAYNLLNSTIPTFFPAPLLGNGQVLNAGVYSISAPATLNLGLTLDAQGNSAAVFIIKIQGAFSTGANSKVKLINGALACNVFWKVEGLVSMASGTTMRGTVIANNAAIVMSAGDTLEGRALSTSGAITVSGVMAYTPIGCGSPNLTGPAAPALATTACYALLSANGPVINSGITHATGDIGTNVGLTTGFNALFVTGAIHPIPDVSTAQAAADLGNVYTYLNTLPYDIELLYPAQFGRNLVLTPHTYLMNAAAIFTDTLFLNGLGNADAVFVIQINGALSTSTYSKVMLKNGTQAKNVFWKVNGAVSINDYSVFEGTIICNNGAIILNTGVTLHGRAMTTTGALSTFAITATMPPGCGTIAPPVITVEPVNQTACAGSSARFTVTATGPGLTYQWRKGGMNLTNGGTISGATNDTLTINPAGISDMASNYNVIVKGTYPPNDTSINVSLTVNPLPVPEITGQNSVCMGATAMAYSTQPGMTNYTWTVAAGGTITSGSGSNTVLVNWNASGVQTLGVNYKNVNGCSPSIPATITVAVNALPVPAISGPAELCAGSAGIKYTTQAGFSNYVWTVSYGGIITAGLNSNQVTVSWATAGQRSISVNYVNTAGCSAVLPASQTVTVLTVAVPLISGNADVCQGSTGVEYSTQPGNSAYSWTVSSGGTILAGAGTNAIKISWNTGGNQMVSVSFANSLGCEVLTPTVFNVNVGPKPAVAGNISGDATVCSGSQDVLYSVPAIANATSYNWTLPSGASIVSGATTNAITVNFALTALSGTFKVNGVNDCGNGAGSTNFAVSVNPIPSTPVITQHGDTLISSAAIGNQWYLDGVAIENATAKQHVAVYTGTYTDVVTLTGCSSNVSNSLLVLPVSVNDAEVSQSFEVYPNPNRGQFTIKVIAAKPVVLNIEIFNNLGDLLWKLDKVSIDGTYTTPVALSNAPAGIYMIALRNKYTNIVRKIVVTK